MKPADHDAMIGGREEIAIVGMAGRFPGAETVRELWENLRDGVESIRILTPEELRAVGVSEAEIGNPDYVPATSSLADGDCFDASFFGYTKREAEIMDPQHRIFLECAWAALEDAGYDSEAYDRAVGVFGGVAPNTYLPKVLMTRPDIMDLVGDYSILIGSEREYAMTRVAYKLNLKGPAISIATACSTSGVAMHLAYQSVLSGETDMALVGGGRVRVPFNVGYRYEPDGILSPDGHCRAFDAEAAGTIRGSGMAIVVIKRLSDAIRDGDTIRALIKGTAINNDGSTKVGYTAPGVAGQEAVIAEALEMAQVDPTRLRTSRPTAPEHSSATRSRRKH
jgi:acyl transferase domain-containing protein